MTEGYLTELQVRIYEYLRGYWREHDRAPTQKEIRRAVNCSTFGIRTAIGALRRQNHIVHERFTERGIMPVDLDRRLTYVPLGAARPPVNAWDSL